MPCLSSSIDGTEERGVRSENAESVLANPARRVLGSWGGDDGIMPVEDVGIGVGYLDFLPSDGDVRDRFVGRGKEGEDE